MQNEPLQFVINTCNETTMHHSFGEGVGLHVVLIQRLMCTFLLTQQ